MPDPESPWTIKDNGALCFDGMVVGKLEAERLTVNLGWAKAAGLAVTVQDDPAVDHHRGGIVLER